MSKIICQKPPILDIFTVPGRSISCLPPKLSGVFTYFFVRGTFWILRKSGSGVLFLRGLIWGLVFLVGYCTNTNADTNRARGLALTPHRRPATQSAVSVPLCPCRPALCMAPPSMLWGMRARPGEAIMATSPKRDPPAESFKGSSSFFGSLLFGSQGL